MLSSYGKYLSKISSSMIFMQYILYFFYFSLMKKFSARKGFTLVELMIVIAIIGILAAVLYPSLMGYLERTRDTNRQQAMNQVGTALGTYFADMNAYPTQGSDKCLDNIKADLEGTGKAVQYLKTLPKDPKAASNKIANCASGYAYFNLKDTSAYMVGAKMEVVTNGNLALDTLPTGLTGKATFNDLMTNSATKTVADAQGGLLEKPELAKMAAGKSSVFANFSR